MNLTDNIYNVINNSKKEQVQVLYDNMSTYQKGIFDELRTNKEKFEDYSLNDLLFDFDQKVVEFLLNLELDLYLESQNIGNKHNGSTKDIHVTMGSKELYFNRPRLRNEKDFDSVIIPKRTRIIKDLTDNIILLYSKNNSVNDIKEILKGMFNIDISTATISKFTNTLCDEILTWRNKELKKGYFTLNIDCTYITIRDANTLTSHKIPVYIAIGTSYSGHKEIVGMYLGNEDEQRNIIDGLYNQDIAESKSYWMTVFNDLKDRGVTDIMYIVSDGLTGIKEAIKDSFPNTFYQRCIVHLVRNLKTYTTKSNCKEIIADFKKIYTANSKDMCTLYYKEFMDKHKDKKTITKKVEEYYTYILPLFDEPENIRKYIYTNNIVESANSKIKRGFYGRGALPNADAAINIIYLNLVDLEKKWKKTKVNNWDNILKELITLHYDRCKDFLKD